LLLVALRGAYFDPALIAEALAIVALAFDKLHRVPLADDVDIGDHFI
jgi:hypothetical protein